MNPFSLGGSAALEAQSASAWGQETHGRASRTVPSAALPLAAAAVVAATGSASGAYFPTSWGWLGLALAWLAAVTLLVRREVTFTALELGMLGSLSAFVCWVALSSAWSRDLPQTVLEVERDLVYPLGLLALLLLGRRRAHFGVLGGLAIGITAVCSYSLATRLFPGRIGSFDPTASISGYRLNEPLGYWNALGIFAVMGALLALGLAASSRSTAIRASAAASLVVLLSTVNFTFSRGAWLALAAGLLAAVAFAPRRLRFVTVTLALAPWPGLAVLVGSRLDGLTKPGESLARATHDGHTLALLIVLLAAAAAVTAGAIGPPDRRLRVPRTLRRAWTTLLILAVVAALAGVSARYGSPPTLVRKAYDSFTQPTAPVTPGQSLERRLFHLSSNGRIELWHAAWRDFAAHPAVGSGAGSYGQYWLEHRSGPATVRDAHSLYVEVLGEMGPIGLLLLLAALGAPLLAAFRGRHTPILPAAAGAYVAYLVHAGVDWDWEMVAVTLTALAIGGSMLLAARSDRRRFSPGLPPRMALLGAVLAVAAFATVGLLGNYPLARSGDAIDGEHWSTAAAEARRAIQWQPWAGAPWRYLGRAERGRGDFAAARRSFVEAGERDPGDWLAWLDLGTVSKGAEQRRAYAEAARLNPLSPRVAELCVAHLVPPGLCPKKGASS